MSSVLVAGALGLAACGGGGGGTIDEPSGGGGTPPPRIVQGGSSLPADAGWTPPAGATPAAGNYLYLDSEPGDTVGGGGGVEVYTDAEATLQFGARYGQAGIDVAHPARRWSAELAYFTLPEQGFYVGVVAPAAADSTHPGQRWSTAGRSCPAPDGWFVFDKLVSVDGVVVEVEMRFVQRCRAGGPALRGQLRWRQADARVVPLAAAPAPLWQPPPGALPATGSFLYLESQGDDPVGQGRTRLLRPSDGTMLVNFIDSFRGQAYSVQAYGAEEAWWGLLQGQGETPLRRGYYPGVHRPLDPLEPRSGIGAMSWGGPQGGCSHVNGWMFVDRVEYLDEWMTEVELRFEQRCDNRSGVLRGKLRWSILDVLPPLGPAAVPANAWRAPAGAVPATGDYVYLESDAGDPVGQGRTRLYAGASSGLAGTTHGGGFSLRAGGTGDAMTGSFEAMDGVAAPTAGLYTALPRRRDPVIGGLDWRVGGAACTEAESWLAIDEVLRAADGSVALLAWRFEQRCAGASGSLRGQGRWTAAGSGALRFTGGPSPLWSAPVDRLPVQGNYLYLESDEFDRLGEGYVGVVAGTGERLDAAVRNRPDLNPIGLSVLAWERGNHWEGRFTLPPGVLDLLPGLYGNLSGRGAQPWHAQADWSGRALNCFSDATGWLMIDHVDYDGDVLRGLDLRFEQLCADSPGSLRGQLRWRADQVPPSPTAGPVPAGLWTMPQDRVPPTGDFLYLESEYGEPNLRGDTLQLGAEQMAIQVSPLSGKPGYLYITVRDPQTLLPLWQGQFARASPEAPMTAGFHGDARSPDPYNPGATLSFERLGYHCNTERGWFVVDEVAYDGEQPIALDLRFELRCDGQSARLHGRLRWRP